MEPLLEKYGVQLYLAGHDHDLEHVHSPGSSTHHILSGAGSQCRGFSGTRDAVFQHAAAGTHSTAETAEHSNVFFHDLTLLNEIEQHCCDMVSSLYLLFCLIISNDLIKF